MNRYIQRKECILEKDFVALNRYQFVTKELRRMMADLPQDARLPGIRALMERFQVSQVTVARALTDLVQSSEVVHRPGRGYFSTTFCAERKRRRVAFCFCYQRKRMDNPLYGVMIAAFLQQADIHDYELNVFACDEMEESGKFRARFEGNQPSCCVLLGCSNQSFLYVLRDLKIPIVQLYPNVIAGEEPVVLIDNHAIIELLIDHLTGLGHKHIAMLHGQGFDNTHMFDQEERMEAFYQILKRRALPFSASRSMLYGGFDTETGYQAAMRLLDTAPELRPSAIIANDYIAAGVYRAAAELGLRIPDDLSVTGIDNLPQCLSLSPLLTTVDIEWSAAVDLVVHLIENPADGNPLRRTPVKLIKRASTGAPLIIINQKRSF